MPKAAVGAEEDESLLLSAAQAYEGGRLEEALSLADTLLARNPRSATAHHLRGATQAELGDAEAALDSYRRAHALEKDDLHIQLDLADLLITRSGEDLAAVEEGLALCSTGRRHAARGAAPELTFDFLLLEGVALNQLGECTQALGPLQEALALCPDSPEAGTELAITLFELARFPEAAHILEQVVETVPEEPWGHHYLGLLAERRGDDKGAKRFFARARELAPEEFPVPVRLSDEEFDRAMEDAVARLPAHVKVHLENTTIAVEPFPSDEELLGADPPLSPTILGVFRGTPIGERSVANAYDHFPASIVLYQRNLERFARTREELIEQIGITVMHEVGHLLGLDEDDLFERGLD